MNFILRATIMHLCTCFLKALIELVVTCVCQLILECQRVPIEKTQQKRVCV
eukprot:m.99319 g.99319  ORF g.99319 m.99319 type:complete len:51 (-) comp13138_c0_seq2:77-229(-)